MVDRATRLRWRRRFRRRRRQVEDMSVQAEEGLERHFFKRLSRVQNVQRFVFAWLTLMLLLIGLMVAQIQRLPSQYKVAVPAPGGVYAEGILGIFTNANPIFVTTPVDKSVSRLLFGSLLTYDQTGKLVGDLAESWSVDTRGTTYTVKLRDNLTWHDGQPVTADDVAFTYALIQNPDAKSPLERSFRGIKVTAKDSHTILFTLPNILSSFPHSLTNGIVPKHKLDNVPVTQLRSDSFNTTGLIGNGPFKLDGINVTGDTPETREQQIGFVPFDNYHGGRPKLNHFAIRSFRDKDRLIKSFNDGDINAMAGLSDVPEELANQGNTKALNVPLDSQVDVFLKNSNGLLADARVRRALVMGTDTKDIVGNLGYKAITSDEPLLRHHIGYNPKYSQFGYNVAQAKKLLSKTGWKPGPDGIRTKKKQRLSLSLTTQDDSDYSQTAQKLQIQWRKLGVELTPNMLSEEELQVSLAQHNYDVLLYGISLGADPDVFPFWHSSQASARSGTWLNFSEYRSAVADEALEAGRTRSDPKIRALKYRPFLDAWRQDAPAIALYQPRFLYVTRGEVYNLNPIHMTSGIDRFSNVENWMIRKELVEADSSH